MQTLLMSGKDVGTGDGTAVQTKTDRREQATVLASRHCSPSGWIYQHVYLSSSRPIISHSVTWRPPEPIWRDV